MLAGQATFTINDALIKLAAAGMPGGQAIFLRGVMAFAVAFTICAAVGGLKFSTLRGHGRILTLRNIGEIGSTLLLSERAVPSADRDDDGDPAVHPAGDHGIGGPVPRRAGRLAALARDGGRVSSASC